MALPQISFDTLSSQGGKPKDYYLLEFFRLYEKYWEDITKNAGNEASIDLATGLLIGCCPHKPTRDKLWDDYVHLKNERGAMTATILTVGDLWEYLSKTLEFTEEAYGSG